MSGLDGIVAGVADDIVPGLQYSLATKRGAKYVKQRNNSTFYPNTSNTYSVKSGQKTIRVLISDAGSSMLDLSTVRIACRINNTSGDKPLIFTGRHLGCMFYRVTTRIKGVIVDDVQYYNRLCGMLSSFKSANANYSDGVCQLGTGYNDTATVVTNATYNATGPAVTQTKANVGEGIRMLGPDVDPIPATKSRRVIFDLPGISALNNHYLLPIGRYPIEITLELVNDVKDVLARGFLNGDGTVSGKNGDAATASQEFTLDEVEVKCDTLLLDSAVISNIEEALVGQKPLSMHLRPWNVTSYNVAGTTTWSQIFNRAYSRLLSIFVNFTPKKVPAKYEALWTQSNLFTSWHGHADSSTFFPGKKPEYDATRDEFRYQIQLGSQLYPNVPIRSHAESYHQLQKCVGELTTGVGVSTGPTYRSTNFHLATDFEKVASTPAGTADFSGVNTKQSGEQMRLFFEKVTSISAGAGDDEFSTAVDQMFILANYDQIVQLRLEGVVLAD
jgi:hypothetical protein